MQLVEMDFAEAMLRAARVKNGKNKTAYVCCDAQRPCFAPSSFDAVLCFGLVPHLPDAREALRRLIEVLKPGGRIAIGHMMGSAQLNALHGSIGGAVGNDRLPEAGEMARLLEQLGARTLRATEDERHYAVVAERD
jgi:ubiquinone/menaquinone biosynthesis C-methylase UbiE